MTWPFILVSVLITAFISGVFGMAGGLLLMGVLALLLPVSGAMVVHGAVQSVSNGWRALLLRRWIDWRVMALYALGSAVAAGALVFLVVELPRDWLLVALGLVPMLVWLPARRLALDARKTGHALFCGFSVTGLNVVAGVSGPLLDVFFLSTGMDRRAIVATKAASQVMAHGVKVAYYVAPALAAGALDEPLWLLAAAPLAVIGTTLGARVLEKLTDRQFLSATKWIVTAIGVFYLARGLWGLISVAP
ncbi:MAG: TSUP family transporter [Maricaulaceae bacterium]|nr:TSUP family transporter [Maricaulaceae bacterium]